MKLQSAVIGFTLGVIVTGCAAPRSVIWDGTTMPRGHVQGQLGMIGSIPTATLSALTTSQMDAAKSLLSGEVDSLTNQGAYDNAAKTLVAAGLDMPSATPVATVHLGVGWETEIGYRREGSVNAWSVRRQILHEQQSGWNGGIGIQYSSQSYELPSALGKIQSTLGYSFDRKDILVPLVFSKPFGTKGNLGSGTIGLVGGWTKINYGFDPKGLYRTWGGSVEALERLPNQESSFMSFGATGMLRGGYKHVWVLVGLTTYWQDYGSYVVPGSDPVELSGFSILPALGLEIRI
ncbi:MAG: hypothetical protein IPN71_14050 [Fibrobacteres bacterium]|nr:hypothetical protein [Fibrobacterota bacterium]